MSFQQLLPLLEAVGQANKHVAKAASFLRAHADTSVFPVRVQVPIIWTVYLHLVFREFRLVNGGDPETAPAFFEASGGRGCGSGHLPAALSIGDHLARRRGRYWRLTRRRVCSQVPEGYVKVRMRELSSIGGGGGGEAGADSVFSSEGNLPLF